MAYIRMDPLHLLPVARSGPPSPVNTPNSISPAALSRERSTSGEKLVLPIHRMRRGSTDFSSAGASSEPSRPYSRSPGYTTSLLQHHRRTSSSLPTTRIVTHQAPAASKRSSVVSTITTEEDEDHAEMGPPPMPKRDARTSLDEGSNRHEQLPLSHSRHRSASSYSTTSTALQTRPQLILKPQAVRPYPRSFHFSQNLNGNSPSSQPTRIPLNRSQTTPTHVSSGAAGQAITSADLQRSGSDGRRRASVDWWAPLRYRYASPPPAGSEGASSSRPNSPVSPLIKAVAMDRSHSERSSFDLERSTGDIGWLEWGRKRLSSMASSSEYRGPNSIAYVSSDHIHDSLASFRCNGPCIENIRGASGRQDRQLK